MLHDHKADQLKWMLYENIIANKIILGIINEVKILKYSLIPDDESLIQL